MEVEVFDPFCLRRVHRISGSTKYEPNYTFRR
jgi:hypothetical protein